MRQYWQLFKISLQSRIADRGNLYLEIVGNMVILLAVIAVWTAVAETRNDLSLSRQQLVAYLLAASLLTNFYRRSQGDEIADDIYHGRLSGLLVKPLAPLMFWLVRDLAIRMLELPFIVLAVVLVAMPFGIHDTVVLSLDRTGLFLLFAIAAWVLHYLLFTSFSLLAFWAEHTWGERLLLNVIIEITSGAIVPLIFFPPFWTDFLRLTPFVHLAATPVEFLLGMKPLTSVAVWLITVSTWLCIVVALMLLLWKKGLKRYEAVGM